jgi:prepilin peptidase CpaA
MTDILRVLFPAVVIYGAFSDLFTMTIRNRLSLILSVGFLVCAVVIGLPAQQILTHCAAGLAMLAVGFALFAFGWIGGGDAKFAAAIVLWIGFDRMLDYTLLSAIAGGFLTVAILTMRSLPLPAFALGWSWLAHLHDRKSGIPYGIALAAAALLVYPETVLWRAAS